MTDSAVLDTVLGLVFLFYALALLCSGLVEMIANWVKKRAKYLLRGIQDLLGNVVAVDMPASEKRRLEEMPATARTLLLNGMVEHRRYDAMLHAPVPNPRASRRRQCQAKLASAWPPSNHCTGTRSLWPM